MIRVKLLLLRKKKRLPNKEAADFFSFVHSPNTMGCAQVRFLLAYQPCNYYVNPLKWN